MNYPNLSQIRNYIALGDFLAICKETNKLFVDYKNKSGALYKHLVSLNRVSADLPYKERKKIKYIDFFDIKPTGDIINKVVVICRECQKEFKGNLDGSLTRHLKEHSIGIKGYVEKYPEEYPLFRNYLLHHHGIGDIGCKECKFKAQSKAGLIRHINNQHSLTHEEYILKHEVLEPPVCECGCGEPIRWNQNQYNNSTVPYFARFISGHNPQNSVSFFEQEIFNYISDELKIADIVQKDRKILKGREIDIYLPHFKIGIECNGTYWHSEQRGKLRNYHIEKKEQCNKEGIRLIHIWSVDWVNKKEVLKSILRNITGKNTVKIFARKCKIKEVPFKEAIKFLEDNHLQGYIPSKVRLGLYNENILVSLMLCGSLRRLNNNVKKEGTYELLRFASLKNTTVIGAASKLFNFFINYYTPEKVISYANYDWATGTVYESLGMQFVGKTEPGYFYVRGTNRYHRYKFAKYKLIQMGYDKEKTEAEIVTELGYHRVWDCGNLKYEWVNPTYL